MEVIEFEIHAREARARSGRLRLRRGAIDTPAFMPVGTAATVKAMLPESVEATGAQIILGNTYHLMLRPTAERIARLGGLHTFMNWHRPILTDSGGFQVMSMRGLRRLSEEGVEFRSHIDGSRHFVSPERSIEIQGLLGSDIVMCFDECTSFPVGRRTAEKSMLLSMRWAERCRNVFERYSEGCLFGIQQGSVFRGLRERSSELLSDLTFDGYAIGGLAVGEGQETMFDVLDYAADLLPADKPRYLMGVGKPGDIVGAVERGVDMFDCVLPTRSGRTGQAFTRRGTINIRNARFADDNGPLEMGCHCPACSRYSRAYLHHLVRCNEILSSMLLTWHNLTFYQRLMAAIRQAVRQQDFASFKTNFATGSWTVAAA